MVRSNAGRSESELAEANLESAGFPFDNFRRLIGSGRPIYSWLAKVANYVHFSIRVRDEVRNLLLHGTTAAATHAFVAGRRRPARFTHERRI